jgi:catechol 2,3-dioxygenase-like lactoylglutathione lyase family enzyme
MKIRRVVPDIMSERMDESLTFYRDFLGFELRMDLGWVTTFVSPSNPTAQIIVLRRDHSTSIQPHLSIEVDNVDEVHAKAIARGEKIVYPLTDESWGVRRFFVADPNGVVINVLSHL